ncbi:kinase [Caulobacter sp. UNC279MFTsu5.1]|uniref:kinase n=1 Tax=Caulobacter sp. UNC279MFTsu5.1 TaxID=1502775 RepID=UPI000381070A|nr:kinase [Caulobacter sp. UNC279MFTsu5.1]SFK06254.1 D-glycerate 3-kinase [Caulobacter sp. UNC279MFTsu5.1]
MTMIDPDWLAAFLREETLPADFAAEVERLHAPLADRIAAVALGPAFVVGICGPQGSGKTTTVRVVAALLEARGLKVATLSLDDLYLPRADREALARDVHPLLRTRGVPGTHDVALGLAVLDGLAGEGETALPRFDKAADDRAPVATWPVVAGPVDVVLLEGWCVGARPEPAEALVAPINALERERDPDGAWRAHVNAALAGPYRALFARVDLLVLFTAPDFETVLAWRREQEVKLRDRLVAMGRAGAMTDDEVAVFVQHYERLTRHIAREMPPRADIVVALDEDRRSSII